MYLVHINSTLYASKKAALVSGSALYFTGLYTLHSMLFVVISFIKEKLCMYGVMLSWKNKAISDRSGLIIVIMMHGINGMECNLVKLTNIKMLMLFTLNSMVRSSKLHHLYEGFSGAHHKHHWVHCDNRIFSCLWSLCRLCGKNVRSQNWVRSLV